MPKSPLFPPRYYQSASDRCGSCVFRELLELVPVFPYLFRTGRGPRVLDPRRRFGRDAGK